MTDEEQEQKAYEAHHERWMARCGFVLPPDPEHPLTKRFWELEEAWHEWRVSFAWKRAQKAIADNHRLFSEADRPNVTDVNGASDPS